MNKIKGSNPSRHFGPLNPSARGAPIRSWPVYEVFNAIRPSVNIGFNAFFIKYWDLLKDGIRVLPGPLDV